MSNPIPTKAFILAAGLGTRLRPYTDTMPKPMVDVNGQSLIERIIEQLYEIGVTDIYINTHYKAEIIEKHLAPINTPRIHIYREETLRDTGGGIKQALKDIGNEPFFAINGDSFIENPPSSSVYKELANAWNPDSMDILLLLEPVQNMKLTHGVGDYTIDQDNHCTRSLDKSGDYMFSSIRINHPRIFESTPDEAFSYLQLMDKAQENGRLYGFINTGTWHHISTPEDLDNVRAHMTNPKADYA